MSDVVQAAAEAQRAAAAAEAAAAAARRAGGGAAGGGAAGGGGNPPLPPSGAGAGGEENQLQQQQAAPGGAIDAEHAAQIMASLQHLQDTMATKCDVLEEQVGRLGDQVGRVEAKVETLQQHLSETESVLAGFAPKLVRIDELLDSGGALMAGGGAGGGKESVGRKQTLKRLSSQWSKENTRRWYAVGQFIPTVSETRMQEIVRDHAVVNGSVHKMINTFSGWKIDAFTPPVSASSQGAKPSLLVTDRFMAVCKLPRGFH